MGAGMEEQDVSDVFSLRESCPLGSVRWARTLLARRNFESSSSLSLSLRLRECTHLPSCVGQEDERGDGDYL